MHNLQILWAKVYQAILEPRSEGLDNRRRELILNYLLGALSFVALLALIASTTAYIEDQNFNGVQSILFVAIFLVLMVSFRLAVWAGYARFVSYLLAIILMALATLLTVLWSFLLPQALLAYVMVIVMTGILLGSRSGIIFTIVAVILLITTAVAEIHTLWKVNLDWYRQAPVLIDALGYAMVFTIIGLVSWLSNREIDRSLYRARQSEAALVQERDSLELKVIERTRELEQTQRMRVKELERFAIFGKISAALVHDVANPLMAATMNLQRLEVKDKRQVAEVSDGLVQIGRHLEAARRQMHGGGNTHETFSVDKELRQVARAIQPVAQRCGVRVDWPHGVYGKLHGDAIKFNQIVSNLLLNAIESYPPGTVSIERVVTTNLRVLKKGLKLTVQDHGSGIAKADISRIFEPFFSKKPFAEHHTGIGLQIVRQFVEQDFQGKVRVSSSPGIGTRFSITLRPVEGMERDEI